MMAKGSVFVVLVLDFADIATAKERLEWPTYIGCPLAELPFLLWPRSAYYTLRGPFSGGRVTYM